MSKDLPDPRSIEVTVEMSGRFSSFETITRLVDKEAGGRCDVSVGDDTSGFQQTRRLEAVWGGTFSISELYTKEEIHNRVSGQTAMKHASASPYY